MPHTTTRDWVRRGASLAAGLLFGLGFALVCLGSAWAASPLRPTASVSATGQIWHVNNAFDDGLVGYWKFDQLSGTATINSAPLGFLTTVSNGASVSASPLPPATIPNFKALHLDGVNDVAQVEDSPFLNVSTTQFSVAAWVRRVFTGTHTSDLIYDSGSQGGNWYFGYRANDHLSFTINGVIDHDSAFTVTDSNWHHVAAVVSGTLANNLTIYLDGLAAPTLSAVITSTPSGVKLIGNKTGKLNTPFSGDIDELRLYSRTLSAAEVGRLAAGRGCVTDGLTWQTPFTDLQCALGVAASGDEIWVARSLIAYRPGTNNAANFSLVSGAGLFGGFQGNELSRSDRPALNFALSIQSTLSGDLFNDDSAPGKTADNAFNVLTASATAPGTVLDGVRVQFGVADGAFPHDRGGGLFVRGGSLLVSNALFIENVANASGGGLCGEGDQLTLDNVIFDSNTASFGGGASNDGPAQINGGQFISNVATSDAGGLVIRQDPLIMTGTQFIDNRAARFAGGAGFQRAATLTGVLFQGNTAQTGGGIQTGAALTMTSSQFISNTASDGGGLSSLSSVSATAVLFVGNIATNSIGGGMHVLGRFNLDRAQFTGNTATGGGALALAGNPGTINATQFLANRAVLTDGGAVIIAHQGSGLSNLVFVGNSAAGRGGGMYLESDGFAARNITAVSNSATLSGSVLFALNTATLVANSIVWHNGSDAVDGQGGPIAFSFDLGDSGRSGIGTLAGNPVFVREPDAGDGDWTTLSDNDYGDLRLQLNSPGIDAGSNSLAPIGFTLDLGGRPRLVDIPTVPDTGVGTAPIIDMGAFEAQLPQLFLPFLTK